METPVPGAGPGRRAGTLITARKPDPKATEEERELALETLNAPRGSEVQPCRAGQASGP